MTPPWFGAWVRWRLGSGVYAGHARDARRRPVDAPARIPVWAWARLAAFKAGRPLPALPAAPKPPVPPVDAGLLKARALLAFCREFNHGYYYGGEHDGSLKDDVPSGRFDCSSSTSFALYHAGLLPVSQAQVSTWFESYGDAGRGRYVTVHANADHVWVEFTLPEGYFRFDTSPHGSGGFGPRVRTGRRSDSGFVARHPEGL